MMKSSKSASRLRELRELAGVSILKAARVAGVSFATLSNIERGFGELKDRQVGKLEPFYGRKIIARLQRVGKSLEVEKL